MTRVPRGYLRLVAVVVALSGVPVAHAATEVNTCGQVLGETGYLSADLDCTGFSGVPVQIENGATLDLRGFTLSGGADSYSAVVCSNGCRLISSVPARGVIRDSSGNGISASYAPVFVSNLSIEGNAGYGVRAYSGSATIEDSSISGNGVVGVSGESINILRSRIADNPLGGAVGYERLRLTQSVVVGNGDFGVRGGSTGGPCCDGKLLIYDSRISRNGDGIEASGSLVLDGSIVEQNSAAGITDVGYSNGVKVNESVVRDNLGTGILWSWGRKAKINDSEIRGNGHGGISAATRLSVVATVVADNGDDGVYGNTKLAMSLRGCEISGNARHGAVHDATGVYQGGCRLKATDTSVVGNALAPGCGVIEPCADIAACDLDAPVISADSICGNSYVLGSGLPGSSWGVCVAD